MPVREVLRMGDPRLLRQARPVEQFGTPGLNSLVMDMLDTMHHLNGAGLAAPQIGVGLQVVIFEITNNPRYPDVAPIPLTVLVNPVVEFLTDEMQEDWEGCLSLPGLRGRVPRNSRIRYRGFDAAGNSIDRTVEGFHARVVQHETDHLHGVLYPMRMRDFSNFGFTDVLFPNIKTVE
jgi:peptide deformylase